LIDSIAYQQKIPYFISILRTPILGSLSISILPKKYQTHSILKLSFYDDSKISDEAIIAYSKPLFSPEGRYAIQQTAKQIIPVDIDVFSSNYKKITIPTLIIWGKEDKVVPLKIGQQLHQDIPNSSLKIIDKCGHNPHEEKPNETVKFIKTFLDTI
jgi:pimeloyl-ACP methyl ester carboxylesterase